ncbi:MAG TPA: hypothetical protein GXX33_08510 [Firmicutes bacterium]|uniref:Outer membrane protein beta-barrel domain-containing protein n=1 Tax=Capillibacterium thermochitinicola TaxID=2699427 RepID=A0A8J6HX56_9FIRM|nr:hypothetical protein [Capillibacterium thermochitinicola]MBA2133002.1 hypothetical protein [Capillibacterium thermochitinicola]HHW13025.1 hypothetical protein [Bacillota bacterium]
MGKTLLVLTLSLLFLLLTVGGASAADFGLGIYDSHDLCFSGKFNLSPDLSVQGLLSGDSLGLRGVYKLAKDANYNFFGFGEFGFVDNEDVAVSAGVGIEFFVFKALKVKELSRLGFSLDFGMNILPDTGFDFGGGFHYYF